MRFIGSLGKFFKLVKLLRLPSFLRFHTSSMLREKRVVIRKFNYKNIIITVMNPVGMSEGPMNPCTHFYNNTLR